MSKKIPDIIHGYSREQYRIPYRPEFARLTGSVLSAILLQQILFRFEGKNYETFYKFIQPCNHDLYKKGDSWTEELAFTYSEFTTAMKYIGTKITKGVKKQDFMTIDFAEFNEVGKFINSNRLVLYWTDASRVTWYWLNIWLLASALKHELLGNSKMSNYLENEGLSNYLVSDDSSITFSSKKTTENTTKKEHAPNGASASKQKATTDNATIGALIEAWHTASNNGQSPGYNNKTRRAEALALHKDGITPQHVKAFVEYRQRDNFYKDKAVSWACVAGNIKVWATSTKPATTNGAAYKPAEPLPDVRQTEAEAVAVAARLKAARKELAP